MPKHHHRAEQLAKQGKFEAAIKEFRSAARLSPLCPDTQYNLGVLLNNQGRIDEAINCYKEAIKIKPDFPEAHYNLGAAFKAVGKLNLAVSSYKNVLSITPEVAEVYFNLGNIYSELRDHKTAIENYNQALKINPKFAEVFNNLGNVFIELGRWDEAIHSFNEAISINNKFVGAYVNRGNVLTELRKLEEAVLNYNKAIKINPKFADAHLSLGNVYKEMGHLDQAIERYNIALTCKPHYVKCMYNLSVALQNKEKFEEAYKVLKKAAKLEPENSLIFTSLVDLLNYYRPKSNSGDIFNEAQNRVEKIAVDPPKDSIIPDEFVRALYFDIEQNLVEYKFPYNYISQGWRGSVFNQNCDRHMTIFNRLNIIPKHCFGCYKIAIEPDNVLDLIKLFLLFNTLRLPNDNPRKCLVELRPEIAGTYKGLIYCRDLTEGENLISTVQSAVFKAISNDIPIHIKRGCSEYTAAYPSYARYKENNAELAMTYKEAWHELEVYAEKNLVRYTYPFSFSHHNHKNFSLRDVLAIRTWLAYAKTIGDQTCKIVTRSD